MKKTTRLIASVLVLVICVGCFGLLCGCKASKLVGTWCFEDDEDYYVVFKSGGKGYMYDDDDPSDKVNFTWTLKGDKLTIKEKFEGEVEKITLKVIEMSSNKIVFDEEGYTSTLIRVKK